MLSWWLVKLKGMTLAQKTVLEKTLGPRQDRLSHRGLTEFPSMTLRNHWVCFWVEAGYCM